MHIENPTDYHTASYIFPVEIKKSCLGIIFAKVTVLGTKWICHEFYVGE